MASNMVSLIASFDRNKMKQTKTRVRTSSGKVYEENVKDGQVNFVGTEVRPSYLEDSMNGYSVIIPGKYDSTQNKWTNCIYNENTPTPTPDCINRITFVTFNLWFWERYLKERALAVFGILEKQRPDILILHFVCLQEVTGAFLQLLKDNPFIQSHYIISDFHGNTVLPYGTMILSHYPIASLKIYSLPTNQGRRFLDAEIVLEKIPGGSPTKKITIFDYKKYIGTIHLESCDNKDMRIAQLNTIFPILSSHENSFFMGDFNFPDSSEEEKHTLPNLFSDLWKEVHKGYNVSLGRDAGEAATTDRGRYDRLFYSSKLFVGTSICLIGTEPLTELSTKEEIVYPSDHKGLFCDFSTKSECCRD